MTENNLTPPPELVQQWDEECESGNNSEVSNTFDALQWFASKAAQWGADQELEACVDFVQYEADWDTAERLRADRRRKVPSLKERALDLVKPAKRPGANVAFGPKELETIRRAIEALPDG
jgi:hypothetical protein